MSTSIEPSAECEDLRREQLAVLAGDHPAGWERNYTPGSFGCHELLDRVNLVGDLAESQVLEHPACLLNPEWHKLALQAVDALRTLYQQVGAEHLDQDAPCNGRPS